MRFQEFNPLKPFKAQVRLKKDKSLVMTLMWADSQHSARRNLSHLYGTENVLNVSQITLTEQSRLVSKQSLPMRVNQLRKHNSSSRKQQLQPLSVVSNDKSRHRVLAVAQMLLLQQISAARSF
jgi:hypothetical protein